MFDRLPDSVVRLLIAVTGEWPAPPGDPDFVTSEALRDAEINRPNQWSTVHDYTSWRALTDFSWSARHLPPYRDWRLPRPSPTQLQEIFRRSAPHQTLCTKSTFLFTAFAQYLSDGFTRTTIPAPGEPEEMRRRNSSNQRLDMSPLYGRTHEQTLALREGSELAGARGRLKSQKLQTAAGDEEFAQFLFLADGSVDPQFKVLDPILGLGAAPAAKPRIFAFGGDRANALPQVAMINTLFLREHNRLAAELEDRNPGWNDDRIFETARNIVIVLFLRIIVEEYLNHISPRTRFRFDPRLAWRASWNEPHRTSAEFGLSSRWHSQVPETQVWNGAERPLFSTLFNNQLLIEAGLGSAFAQVSAQKAGRLGPFNTPPMLMGFELDGIEHGCLLEFAPYGQYRRFVGLESPVSFADVSPDPAVGRFLEKSYENPAEIDFIVGAFAEPPVRNSPLPALILRITLLNAISQVFSNPLLSERVYRAETFSPFGWEVLNTTRSLEDIVVRNSAGIPAPGSVRMTQSSWQPV